MSNNILKKKSEFIDLQSIFFKYVKYWKWFLLSAFIFAILSIAYVLTVAPTYNISANVIIKDEKGGSSLSSSVSKNIGLASIFGGGSSNVEDEAVIMASYSSMKNVGYDLGLYKRYTLKKFPFNKQLYNNSPIELEIPHNIMDTLSVSMSFDVDFNKDKSIDVIYKVKNKKRDTFHFKSLPAVMKTPSGDFLLRATEFSKKMKRDSYSLKITLSSLGGLAESLTKKVSVIPNSKKSEIISLEVEDVIPQRGEDILNNLMNYYNKDALSEKHETARSTVAFVDERIVHLAAEVDSLERNIEHFKKSNNLTDISLEAKAFIEQYREVQEKITTMDVQLSIVNLLEKYISAPENKYNLIPMGLQSSEGASEAVSFYNQAILERIRLLRSGTEDNPVVMLLEDRISSLRSNVVSSIRNMQKDAEIQKNYMKTFEKEMQNRMLQMPTQEREYIDIQRQQLVKSELYVFLLTKKEETQLILASKNPKAKIIDQAYTYSIPISPKKGITVIFLTLIGLMLPFIFFYIKDLLKFKISSRTELEEHTILPVLGEVCLSKSNSKIVIKSGVDTSIAELFRLIRTNLQFLMKKDKKVLLITSSISGEGKTFFSINLALSFSLIKNKKIALVGLDIRNPKLTEYLSIDNKKGLTLFLATDDMKPEEIISHRPDLHDNLYVIPAGPVPPNPSELLLSDRLDEFFEYLKDNFDYILVDTAPVGMVSDTFSLDRISDLSICVFRANYTNKSYLKFIESSVEEQKLRNLSLILNGTTTKTSYGYGYGYGNKDHK